MPKGIYLHKKGYNLPSPTKKTRQKMRDARLGKKQSLETIQKRIESKKGYKHSEETKRKIGLKNSIALKGKKGHKWTEEEKIKASISRMGEKNPMFRKIPYNKGKPALKGKDSPNWKGGTSNCSFCGKKMFYLGGIKCMKCRSRDSITPENIKIRGSQEMKLWKKACLERDNWTCQKTGQRGGRLQVHHINNFADFKELRTSINNGITFSKESHEEFHRLYGRKNNTMEQVKEFINS